MLTIRTEVTDRILILGATPARRARPIFVALRHATASQSAATASARRPESPIPKPVHGGSNVDQSSRPDQPIRTGSLKPQFTRTDQILEPETVEHGEWCSTQAALEVGHRDLHVLRGSEAIPARQSIGHTTYAYFRLFRWVRSARATSWQLPRPLSGDPEWLILISIYCGRLRGRRHFARGAPMDLNTVADVVRRPADRPGANWRDGDAWLAGGTWLFSEQQPELRRLVDLTTLGWDTLVASEAGLEIGATCTIRDLYTLAAPDHWRLPRYSPRAAKPSWHRSRCGTRPR